MTALSGRNGWCLRPDGQNQHFAFCLNQNLLNFRIFKMQWFNSVHSLILQILILTFFARYRLEMAFPKQVQDRLYNDALKESEHLSTPT